jgi:hypothetical protein
LPHTFKLLRWFKPGADALQAFADGVDNRAHFMRQFFLRGEKLHPGVKPPVMHDRVSGIAGSEETRKSGRRAAASSESVRPFMLWDRTRSVNRMSTRSPPRNRTSSSPPLRAESTE